MGFAEKSLICINCKKHFTFTVEEQKDRSSRGYPNNPVRCLPCRRARVPQSTQTESASATKYRSGGNF